MNFSKLRKQAGFLNQQSLADKLGIDRTTVGKWEVGKSMPRSKDLPVLAELLGVTERQIIDCIKRSKK